MPRIEKPRAIGAKRCGWEEGRWIWRPASGSSYWRCQNSPSGSGLLYDVWYDAFPPVRRPSKGVEPSPFLVLAANLCKDEIFELLLSNGAPITIPELLDYAVDGGGGRLRPSVRIVQRIMNEVHHDAEALTRCLRFACVSGNPDVVRLLIQQGADPNRIDKKFKDFPLLNAVRHGHTETVDVLLHAGANPTQPVWEENEMGEFTGKTLSLVDVAIRQGFPEIAKLLG